MSLPIRIVALAELGSNLRHRAAAVLKDAFAAWPDAWPTLEAAHEELEQSLGPDRISLVALSDQEVVGWIAAISMYHGQVWELHPMAVRPEHQGRGVGTALVAALEDEVRARGGCTVYLGTDDLSNLTSIGGVDLYPGVLENVARIENRGRHPFGFYQRIGFEVVGVIPDANGFGKPDIMMAKRVGSV